jgi:hypothetical protein
MGTQAFQCSPTTKKLKVVGMRTKGKVKEKYDTRNEPTVTDN